MGKKNGLIARQDAPLNLEAPCSVFDSFLTPHDLFYVRNHFDVPEIQPAAWRLRIEGAVEQARQFSYAELLEMPSRTVAATLECAGNSRTLIPWKTKGVQWELGAVGTADWTGVPLQTILVEAGLQADAAEIILEGADSGVEKDPASPGPIPYARSLPLRKAVSEDVLLAYQMNGAGLAREHGFPIRAIVPGWYGMASVKWLQRIIVSREPFAGYFQTLEYSRWEERNGITSLVPLTNMGVKSVIAEPTKDEVLRAGVPFRIHGAAWAGESELSEVDLSVDGGDSWSGAQLLDEPRKYCWVRWEFWWNPEQSGPATLMARATDVCGRSQGFTHPVNSRHYAINHVFPVPVRIE